MEARVIDGKTIELIPEDALEHEMIYRLATAGLEVLEPEPLTMNAARLRIHVEEELAP